MAQAITNTVQSSNPFAGLLGLNPKPLASGISGSTTSAINKPLVAAPAPVTLPTFDAKGMPIQNNKPTPVSLNLSGTSFNQPQPTGASPATTGAVNTGIPTYTANAGGLVKTQPQTQTYAPGSPQNSGALQTSAQPTTPTKGLFSDVASSLAYGAPAANAALGANAQKIAADAGSEIARLGGQGARFEAGQLTTGTTPVAEGNAAVTAQTTAAQQQAIAQGANVALTGNQQALTGQSQTQSALNSVGGLTQPQVTAYGQTSFDPTTGTFAGGANGGLPAEVMQQYAQMASSGQYSAIPSFITSNPVLNAQLNVAAKALNPNFSPVQAAGASGVLAGIPALTSANAAADGIKNTIQTYLQSNPQLNPSDLVAGNKLSQWLQSGQFGDPKYQTLGAYLSEYVSTLAPILGVGGDTTNLKTQIAQGMVNAAASGKSISEVLDNIATLATHKITDIQSGAVGGGTAVPNTAGGSTSGGQIQTQASDGNSYSFHQDANGNWVAN